MQPRPLVFALFILAACGGAPSDHDRSSDNLDADGCELVCDPGSHCELEEVVCVRAPCPPQPTCVEDAPSCDDVTCDPGYRCELQTVECFRAPCPPVPVCVEAETAPSCDDVVCENGDHCELEDVVCVRAPCPPVPVCVP